MFYMLHTHVWTMIALKGEVIKIQRQKCNVTMQCSDGTQHKGAGNDEHFVKEKLPFKSN